MFAICSYLSNVLPTKGYQYQLLLISRAEHILRFSIYLVTNLWPNNNNNLFIAKKDNI